MPPLLLVFLLIGGSVVKAQDNEIRCICGIDSGPRDCADIRALGFSVSGTYRVYPRRITMDVYCDFTCSTESWLVFQRRINGSTNFRRTYNEYKTGFGNLAGEFWLGNDKLSTITMNRKYKLRIEMEDFEGVKRWAEYSTFSVGPATDRYRLTATGITGTAGPGDSMAYNNGKQFGKALDGNGMTPCNCSVPLSGGGWFTDCLYGNLNGRYRSIFWYYQSYSYYSLKATEMKICAVQ